MASRWRTQDEDLQTYEINLPDWLPSEIRKEIILFAADGVDRVGKYIDVQDKYKMWSISKVIAVDKHKILVHFCGWIENWDFWINYEEQGHLLAPLFSQTTPTVDAAESCREATGLDHGTCDQLLKEFAPMGLSKENILDVLLRYHLWSGKHNAVNAIVYWTLGGPLENIPKQLVKVLERQNTRSSQAIM
eukprot:TRINITY_DN6079_c0_g1_i3.p1 TRINITY_DN6079_c0_g1~~TRINITY_DN6079_c0_g1_i3.p1  ORF type:complete len:190 (-),score=26.94 TRINITY_DN6079_c0_g1_i3:37-606(-)